MTAPERYLIRRPSSATLTATPSGYAWCGGPWPVPVIADRATADALADRYGGTVEAAP